MFRAAKSRVLMVAILSSVMIALLSLCPAGPVMAQTDYTWTGAGASNLWSEAANWEPEGLPPDGARITIGMGHLVLLDIAVTIRSLTLEGRLEVVGRRLTIQRTGSTGNGIIENYGELLIGSQSAGLSELVLSGPVQLSGFGEFLFDGATSDAALLRATNNPNVMIPEDNSLVLRGLEPASSRFTVDIPLGSSVNEGELRFGAAQSSIIDLQGLRNLGKIVFSGDGQRFISGPVSPPANHPIPAELRFWGGVNRIQTANWRISQIEIASTARLECYSCQIHENVSVSGAIDVLRHLFIYSTPNATADGWSVVFGRSAGELVSNPKVEFVNDSSTGAVFHGFQVHESNFPDQIPQVWQLQATYPFSVELSADTRLRLFGETTLATQVTITGPGTLVAHSLQLPGGALLVNQATIEASGTWNQSNPTGSIQLGGSSSLVASGSGLSLHNLWLQTNGSIRSTLGFDFPLVLHNVRLDGTLGVDLDALDFSDVNQLDGTIIRAQRIRLYDSAALSGYGRFELHGNPASLTAGGGGLGGAFVEGSEFEVAAVDGDLATVQSISNLGTLSFHGGQLQTSPLGFTNAGVLRLWSNGVYLNVTNYGGRIERHAGRARIDLIRGGVLAESDAATHAPQSNSLPQALAKTPPLPSGYVVEDFGQLIEGVELTADITVDGTLRVGSTLHNNGRIRFSHEQHTPKLDFRSAEPFDLNGHGEIDFGQAQDQQRVEVFQGFHGGGPIINHGNTLRGHATLMDDFDNRGLVIIDDATGMALGGTLTNHGRIELNGSGSLWRHSNSNAIIENHGEVQGGPAGKFGAGLWLRNFGGQANMAGSLFGVSVQTYDGRVHYTHPDRLGNLHVWDTLFPVGGPGIGTTAVTLILSTNSDAALAFQLAGPEQHDRLQLISSITHNFNGHIAVQTVGDFRPEPGQRFRLIELTSGTPGTPFDGVLNHTRYPDLTFTLEYWDSDGDQPGAVELVVGGSNDQEIRPDPAVVGVTACRSRVGFDHEFDVDIRLGNLGEDPAEPVMLQVLVPAGLVLAPDFVPPPGCTITLAGLHCTGLDINDGLQLPLPLIATSQLAISPVLKVALEAPIDVKLNNNSGAARVHIQPDLLFHDNLMGCL